MDGTSSNTMMMQVIEAHLNPHQIDYDAVNNHIICIEHNTANTINAWLWRHQPLSIQTISMTSLIPSIRRMESATSLPLCIISCILFTLQASILTASTIRSSSEMKQDGLVMWRFLSDSCFMMSRLSGAQFMLCSRDSICCDQYVLFWLNLSHFSFFDHLGHWPVPFSGERCCSSEDYQPRMVRYWPIASCTTGKHYGPIRWAKAILICVENRYHSDVPS